MTDHLIIYPNFGQKISTWNIGSDYGKYNIPLMNTTDTDSVLLYVLTLDNSIKNVEYKHIHFKELFSIGMKVSISGEINTYGNYVSGYISKINNDFIDIISNIDGHEKTYRINDYKTISAYGKSTQSDTLVVNIKQDDKGQLKLSYLFNNIGWSAHYKIVINNDIIQRCVLTATINNQNREDFKGNVILVAGSVSKPYTEQPKALMSSPSQSRNQLSNEIQDQENFEEYFRYNIGYHELTNENRIDLVTCENTPSKKYYSHDISSHNHVSYGYKFSSPTFFPNGKVYLYSQKNDDMFYIGTSNINESREKDEIDLSIGKTTQVQANSNISETGRKIIRNNDVNSNNIETDERVINIETTINNKTNDSVLFILRYYVGNLTVVNVSTNITRRRNGYLEWDVMANIGKSNINILLTLA